MRRLLCLVLFAAGASQACERLPEPGLSGAYRQRNGGLLSVLPAGAPGRWQITHFDSGLSQGVQPRGPGRFESAAEGMAPFSYRFQGGQLRMQSAGQPPLTAQRLALRERLARFDSGGTALFGQLTLPPARLGPGPFKTVVFVHGSDPVPSVGREWLPHWLAAHGIATLVFDKRGSGCSKGEYTQHFGVLADDVVAAVHWLMRQPEVDATRIGLAGFSQGGWVAPLAALKEPRIAFVAVAYGLAMSLADEDRLEAPLKLRQAGVDEAGVAEFEQLNTALHQLARDGFPDWAPFEQQLAQAQARPWFALAAQQPSWLGVLMQMGLPQAKAVAPPMFKSFFQPFYEPVPTLEALSVPQLWLIAEQDIEAPPGPTIAALRRLQARGKPLTLRLFPHADHGMQDFVLRDGKRVRTRYADGYFDALLSWLRQQR